ncbi:MAG: RagB/SusD family nutrient uptake outer membrane protein [Bacteroidota bacterium]
MRINKIIYLLFCVAVLTPLACTDLEEKVLDETIGEGLLDDPTNAESLVAPAYASLYFVHSGPGGFWGISQHTSDETMGPTRGTDWDDNGVWRVLHTHQWDPFHREVEKAWNDLNNGVARSNVALSRLAAFPESADITRFKAELRFLRAYYMFHINDLFGQTPFRSEDDNDFVTPPTVLDRRGAADFIISEMDAIINDLGTKAEVPYGRISKGAARMLKAKTLLNYEVYTGEAKWGEAVTACDEIINSGEYAINDDYFANFATNNEQTAGDEAIFVIQYDRATRTADAIRFWCMTMHYNQDIGVDGFSPWNGFTTVAEFYDKFDPADERLTDDRIRSTHGINLGFLEGRQVGVNGDSLTDRAGAPLIFTKEVPLFGANESQGIRVVKYTPDNESGIQDRGANDFLVYRISDVYLMRAEAHLRNGNAGSALSDVNTLRQVRNVPDLTAATLDNILDERGRELYWEAHRRTDLIRFGKFQDAWAEKNGSTPNANLFTIPQAALDVNPNLTQNALPGGS